MPMRCISHPAGHMGVPAVPFPLSVRPSHHRGANADQMVMVQRTAQAVAAAANPFKVYP